MKIVHSTEPGGPETLVIDDIADPVAADGEVVVAVEAVGVNFPDVLIIQDLYQFKPPRPFAPGAELAGVVESVGTGVTHVAVGDRVMATMTHGAMAEKVALPATSCLVVPDSMAFDEAAAFCLTYGTSHHALRNRADAVAGETLFILGASGGVGLAAVQLGKAMGLHVIAGCSTQAKVDLCLEHGADAGIVYPTGSLDRDQQKALSAEIKAAGGGGVDIVYDAVGGDLSEPALRALNWEGRFLVVGFVAGIPRIPLNLTLLKSCQIVGVFWGAFTALFPDQHAANMRELFDLHAAGKIKPFISSRHPLDEAPAAITELMERRALGKVVITV